MHTAAASTTSYTFFFITDARSTDRTEPAQPLPVKLTQSSTQPPR